MFSDDDGRPDNTGDSPKETGKRSALVTLVEPERPTKRCGFTRCPEDVVLVGRHGATQQHELKRWPQEMADWVGHLEAAIGLRRSRLGAQIRALKVAAGFAGLGSHTQVFRESGLLHRDMRAAEPKPHAKEHQRANNLMAEHHYDNITDMTEGLRAPCARCGTACPPPTERPDIFIAGFSCQAFSTMRAKSFKSTPPHRHPKFSAIHLTVEYILRRRPLSVLLENTMGLRRRVEVDGENISGLQYLKEALHPHYHVAWVPLDLCAWVSVRRPRWWIFAIATELGSEDLVMEACAIATEIQANRARFPPSPLNSFAMTRGTHEWDMSVLLGMSGQLEALPSRRPAEEMSWKKQVDLQRSAWRLQGIPGHDSHPLATAALRGLRGTAREREILEVYLMAASLAKGLSLNNADLHTASQDLTADVSQNLSWLRPDTPGVSSVFCTGSRIYSFKEDRILLAEELLGAVGWRIPGRQPPTCSTLSNHDLQDMVGECMALPCLAAAAWALILAIGDRMPDAWSSCGAGQALAVSQGAAASNPT